MRVVVLHFISLFISWQCCMGFNEKEVALMIISADKALENKAIKKSTRQRLIELRDILKIMLPSDVNLNELQQKFKCPKMESDEIDTLVTRMCVLRINMQRDEIDRAIKSDLADKVPLLSEDRGFIERLCLCGLCGQPED